MGLKKSRTGLVVSKQEYTVDGGSVCDGVVGRIDMTGKKLPGINAHLAASLYVTREQLQLYPIGSKVRVTVERFT